MSNIKTIEDKIEKRLFEKLLIERNKVAKNYLFEIISLESEYLYLYAKYEEEKQEYLKDKIGGIDAERDIMDDYWIFSQNLIYRYYSLLQKFSQLINALWIKEFKEDDCSFKKVKDLCGQDKKFELINKELNKIDIEPVKKILENRRRIVHRRALGGVDHLFILRDLPPEWEHVKDFLKWEEESKRVLEAAYEKTFEAMESVFTIYLN